MNRYHTHKAVCDVGTTKDIEREAFKLLEYMVQSWNIDAYVIGKELAFPLKIVQVQVLSAVFKPYFIIASFEYKDYKFNGVVVQNGLDDINDVCRKLMERAIATIRILDNKKNRPTKSKIIEKVIFNNPATIVFWKDGTKTVVKCGPVDEFDKEKGLAMAIAKKLMSDNKGNYYETFKKYIPELED